MAEWSKALHPIAPPSRLRLKTDLVYCGHIPSGCATSLYLLLCVGREILSQPTQVCLKSVSSSISKTGVTRTTELGETLECFESVSRMSQGGCALLLSPNSNESWL